jgi:hypothetical protein
MNLRLPGNLNPTSLEKEWGFVLYNIRKKETISTPSQDYVAHSRFQGDHLERITGQLPMSQQPMHLEGN